MKVLIVSLLVCCMPLTMFSQARVILNSDFETPTNPPNSFRFYHHSLVDGWSSTSSSGLMEFWRSPFNGVTSASGQQHIELNATQPSDLYVEICMFNNESFTWSFYHRGRSGLDSARLLIGPPGAEVQILRFGTGNTNWVQYTGNYTNTHGNTLIRILLQPISTASGNQTVGNFIDLVEITGLAPVVEFEKNAYSDTEASGGNIPNLIVNGRVPSGGLGVDLNITGGSASSSNDFNHTTTFIIPEGNYDGSPSSVVSIAPNFSVNDDFIDEPDEDVVLTLANPQGGLIISDANCDAQANRSTRYTILDEDITFPIELSSFTAFSDCEQTQLSWSTAMELNNNYFQIEHSVDGINWTKIGQVPSRGNSTETQHYDFLFKEIFVQNYFRLRQVDFDGSFSYSPIVTTKLTDCNLDANILVYPNPVHHSNTVSVKVNTLIKEPLQLRIIDMCGRLLMEEQVHQNRHDLNIEHLSPGVYQVLVETANTHFVRRLIIQ
ncbi:T9SS type A sorting domain-containing protein [Aureispira sp. CCB-QB1]|uniref:T9SS type A sorting domain-containing protein n=1 Tax=Aureispira sp. CCB-QB1 TaxID=1313421 RepID=UPI0009DDE498|nr:T9SS type A sorting domain-containing protein [Aureispira sp. CCB-QB1]